MFRKSLWATLLVVVATLVTASSGAAKPPNVKCKDKPHPNKPLCEGTAPTVTIDKVEAVNTIPGGPTATVSIFFTVTGDPAPLVECALDGGAFVPCASPVVYTDVPNGQSHTVVVRATNAFGETSASTTFNNT